MSIINIIILSISALSAYIAWDMFAGKHEGDRVGRSFRLKISKYRLHIHHWIYFSILLILCSVYEITNPYIIGIHIGSILQGLRYRDRFIVFYKDSDYKKIYSKFK